MINLELDLDQYQFIYQILIQYLKRLQKKGQKTKF